jgi:hypothetical protein
MLDVSCQARIQVVDFDLKVSVASNGCLHAGGRLSHVDFETPRVVHSDEERSKAHSTGQIDRWAHAPIQH